METTQRRFSFDLAAVWVLAVAVGLAALIFIPSSTIPFVYTKVSLLAVGAIVTLALFILARLTRGNLIVPPALLLGAVWFVPIAYGLSTLFSGVPIKAAFFGAEMEADTLGFVVLSALLATLTALVLRRREQIRTFVLVLAGAFGLVILAEAIFIIVGQVAPNSVSATANLIGSFSDVGILVGLSLSLSLLALRFLTLPSRIRMAILVAGVVSLVVLALVNSVLIWILVGLVALGLFIESIMRRRPMMSDDDLEGVSVAAPETSVDEGSRSVVAPLVVLVIALFFTIGGATIGNALAGGLHASVLDVRPSWSSTFAVGSHTYASSPVFGTGPGTFGQEWLKYRDASLNSTLFWNVDFTSGIGYIPTSLVTTGALGALAWLAFLGLLLYFGVRFLLMKAPADPFLRYVSLASFVGAIYLFALSIFTVPGSYLIILGFVFVGLFISTTRYGEGAREWGVAFARSPRLGFLVVFCLTLLLLASVLAIYVVSLRYFADVAYDEGAVALNAGNLTAAQADAARSILFAPTDRSYRLSAAVGVAQLNQIASDTTLAPDQARTEFQSALSTAVSDALTATQLGPNDYQNWATLGGVYSTVVPLGIQGAYDNAKTAYQHSATLNPTNPVIPYIMAQLEIAQKNGPAAETDLTNAINLKQDYTQAIFLLSQLEVQEGKATEALQAAEAAAYFAPSDPTVLFQVGILRLGTGNVAGAVAALQAATKVNPQYANAHFFLAVAYAAGKDYPDAITELQTVATLSPNNVSAVTPDITALQAGKNPFPATTLAETPVSEPASTTPQTAQ